MSYIPKIITLIPNVSDATSYYRATGVLSKMRYVMDCDFLPESNVSWNSLAWCDIAFAQRPFGESFYKACNIIKNNNIPLWIDFDDYLIDVPEWNPFYKFFKNEKDKQEMLEMIQMADCISVTTEMLKEKYLKYNSNVFVVPNAFNDYTFKFEYNFIGKKSITWRGSNTHSEDLRSILEPLRELQNNNYLDEWIINTIGDDSKILKGLVRHKQHPVIDPIEYFKFIKTLNSSIQLVPLTDIDFNKSKSNIGWIEGIYSGAICIAPFYLREFDRKGVIRYSNKEQFKNILIDTLKDVKSLEPLYKEGYEFIRENLLLSKVNLKRKEIILKLMDLKK
jgi:hypothetical protein